MKLNSTSIAVVARDANGYVLKAWARCVDMDNPVIAEAFAIKWTLELAKEESFTNIIVESDSKIYIDSFEVNSVACCWKIDPLDSNVNSLATYFLFCCFSWVKRETNTVAHMLASIASSLHFSLSCNVHSLPPSVCETWQRDVLGLSFI